MSPLPAPPSMRKTGMSRPGAPGPASGAPERNARRRSVAFFRHEDKRRALLHRAFAVARLNPSLFGCGEASLLRMGARPNRTS